MRGRLAGDALALGVLDAIHRGEGKAGAQARALGVPVTDVYAAKRRIAHHARAVAKAMEQGEG